MSLARTLKAAETKVRAAFPYARARCYSGGWWQIETSLIVMRASPGSLGIGRTEEEAWQNSVRFIPIEVAMTWTEV